MALLGQSTLLNYRIVLNVGKHLEHKDVLAADSESAAWLGLELSKDRNATLSDILLIHE